MYSNMGKMCVLPIAEFSHDVGQQIPGKFVAQLFEHAET